MPSILRTPLLAAIRPRVLQTSLQPAIRRSLQASTAHNGKKDDLMDRESMNTTSTEYSKSGGDDQTAHESEAFDPNTTRPEEAKKEGSKRRGGDSENPLQVSPGNPEVSKPSKNAEEGGGQSQAQSEKKRGATSGPGGNKSG